MDLNHIWLPGFYPFDFIFYLHNQMQTRVNTPNLTCVYAIKTCQTRTPPVSNQTLRAQPGRVAMELLLLMLLCRLGSSHSAQVVRQE